MRSDVLKGTLVDSAELQIDLVGFSVVVVAEANNPTILNPDFLRHNGIVASRWRLSENSPPITSPLLSAVIFDGGLTVQADPNRVTFEQRSSALSLEDIECVDMVKGYLKTVPHVPYTAFGLNPHAVVRNPSFSRLSDMLHSSGGGMTFNSVVPRFELKAIYEMAGKRLTLDLQEGQNEHGSFMLCHANIHRDIAESNQQMRVNSMLSFLDSWRNDLDEFRAVVAQSLLADG